jgi:hypothetical protein
VTARNITPKTMVSVAIRQAHGSFLVCPLCKDILWADEPRILEHMNPLALSKDNSIENLRWVHKACADLKTRGCTGTSKKGSVADGDLHKLAKAKRLANPKPSKHPMPKTNRKIPAHVNPWGKR